MDKAPDTKNRWTPAPIPAYHVPVRLTPSAYAYDGLPRRIVRTIDNSADLDHTYHDYYDGQSVVETRNGSDQVLKQHVWGVTYVDELVQVAINGEPVDDPEFDPADGDHDGRYYYAVHNANYNVQLLLDDNAVVVERYEYEPYGERTVYISPGSNDPDAHAPALLPQRVQLAGADQPYGICEFGHQGLMHDDVSGLIYNRARMLHPTYGNFMSRDPLGPHHIGNYPVSGTPFWRTLGPASNQYEYIFSTPGVLTDPSGKDGALYDPDGDGASNGPPPPNADFNIPDGVVSPQTESDILGFYHGWVHPMIEMGPSIADHHIAFGRDVEQFQAWYERRFPKTVDLLKHVATDTIEQAIRQWCIGSGDAASLTAGTLIPRGARGFDGDVIERTSGDSPQKVCEKPRCSRLIGHGTDALSIGPHG